MQSGNSPDVDPAMVAMLLVGTNVFFFQSRNVLWHFPDVSFADDTAAYSRMLIDILMHGISALPLKINTKHKDAARSKAGV